MIWHGIVLELQYLCYSNRLSSRIKDLQDILLVIPSNDQKVELYNQNNIYFLLFGRFAFSFLHKTQPKTQLNGFFMSFTFGNISDSLGSPSAAYAK